MLGDLIFPIYFYGQPKPYPDTVIIPIINLASTLGAGAVSKK